MPSARGSSPAKLILFGEHAVGYQQVACGVALDKQVRVELRPGSGRVTVTLARGIRRGPLQLEQATRPEALVQAALGPLHDRLDTAIALEVPPGAGFGTSAALAIALIRAREALRGATPKRSALIDEAIRIECLAHGASSGLDPSLCLAERALRFRRTDAGRQLRAFTIAPLWVVIGAAGAHGGTRAQVGRMAILSREDPALCQAAVGTLGTAAECGIRALKRGDRLALLRATNLAHGVLSGLGLVGETIDRLVHLAREAGAIGAKMSGAGGDGGAFLAFAEDQASATRIARRLRREGVLVWAQRLA